MKSCIEVKYDCRRPNIDPISGSSLVEIHKVFEGSLKPVRSGKSYAIMFSGGYDSMALMINHLLAGDEVYPYFVGFDTGASSADNRDLTNLAVDSLRYIYGDSLCHPLQTVCYINHTSSMEGSRVQQALLSVMASLLKMPKCKVEAIEIGFCVKDCAISFMKELKALYKATANVVYNNRYVPLKFPLYQIYHEENVDVCHKFEKAYGVTLPIHRAEMFTETYYWSDKEQCSYVYVLFNNRLKNCKPDIYKNMLIKVSADVWQKNNKHNC